MADALPIKANFSGADPISLGEFQTGDTVPIANGGTGRTDGVVGGFKNKTINGEFDFWQRGTSLIGLTGAQTQYLADRWQTNCTGHTFNYTQQSFVLGQTDVPGEPTYWARYNITANDAGASSNCILQQKHENVRTLAGKQVTLSFYAKSDASRNMSVEITQNFGTGGSPSAAVTGTGVTKIALTSSWQKFTITTTIPSIAGKTLGSDGNSFLGLLFWFSAGTSWNSRTNSLGLQTGIFDVAQVQLEEGATATAFEKRPLGIESLLCYRYYEKSFSLEVTPAQGVNNDAGVAHGVAGRATTGQQYIHVQYKFPKRTTPTLVFYNPNAANAQARDQSTGTDCSSTTALIQGRTGVIVVCNGSGSTAIGSNLILHWTADAEL